MLVDLVCLANSIVNLKILSVEVIIKAIKNPRIKFSG